MEDVTVASLSWHLVWESVTVRPSLLFPLCRHIHAQFWVLWFALISSWWTVGDLVGPLTHGAYLANMGHENRAWREYCFWLCEALCFLDATTMGQAASQPCHPWQELILPPCPAWQGGLWPTVRKQACLPLGCFADICSQLAGTAGRTACVLEQT